VIKAASIRRRIRIPLRFVDGYSTSATVVSFTGLTDAQQHVALELGRPAAAGPPLVRLHSECLTGDVFGSQRGAAPDRDQCRLPGHQGPARWA
jgi:GTP cyclohydrolase II